MICNDCLDGNHGACSRHTCRCIACHPAPADTCEHGVSMDVHCCNCHAGVLLDISACTCFFDEAARAVDRATLAERMGVDRIGGRHGAAFGP